MEMTIEIPIKNFRCNIPYSTVLILLPTFLFVTSPFITSPSSGNLDNFRHRSQPMADQSDHRRISLAKSDLLTASGCRPPTPHQTATSEQKPGDDSRLPDPTRPIQEVNRDINWADRDTCASSALLLERRGIALKTVCGRRPRGARDTPPARTHTHKRARHPPSEAEPWRRVEIKYRRLARVARLSINAFLRSLTPNLSHFVYVRTSVYTRRAIIRNFSLLFPFRSSFLSV